MDVALGPPAKKKATGSSKWSLDPSLEVSLRMRAASDSTGDQKVRAAAAGWDVEGGQQVAEGGYSQAVPRGPPAPARPGSLPSGYL